MKKTSLIALLILIVGAAIYFLNITNKETELPTTTIDVVPNLSTETIKQPFEKIETQETIDNSEAGLVSSLENSLDELNSEVILTHEQNAELEKKLDKLEHLLKTKIEELEKEKKLK